MYRISKLNRRLLSGTATGIAFEAVEQVLAAATREEMLSTAQQCRAPLRFPVSSFVSEIPETQRCAFACRSVHSIVLGQCAWCGMLSPSSVRMISF